MIKRLRSWCCQCSSWILVFSWSGRGSGICFSASLWDFHLGSYYIPPCFLQWNVCLCTQKSTFLQYSRPFRDFLFLFELTLNLLLLFLNVFTVLPRSTWPAPALRSSRALRSAFFLIVPKSRGKLRRGSCCTNIVESAPPTRQSGSLPVFRSLRKKSHFFLWFGFLTLQERLC